MAENQEIKKTTQDKTGRSLCLVVAFVLGFTTVAFGAGTPKPKQAGQLWVVDATGKKVGKATSLYDAAGRGAVVAFKFGAQSFLLALSRHKAEAPTTTVFFTSEDCSGQAYLNDQGGTDAALAKMGLLVGLSGNDATIWVVDHHITSVQTIIPKSSGYDGGGSVPGWHCYTDITGSVEAFPATQLFDFYHEFTPPFEIR